jgi:hypothetical protein
MHSDMAKVIVERSRRGWNGGHKKSKHELDVLPTKEGMRRGIIGEKYLNENLSPLCRFLVSQIGRPWSKVYKDGELEQPHGWRWRWGRQALYVDPRDDILKRTTSEREWRRRALQRRQESARKKAHADKIVVDAMKELVRINGVWYAVDYAPLPLPRTSPSIESRNGGHTETSTPTAYYDVVLRSYVGLRDGYSVSKRKKKASWRGEEVYQDRE